MAARFPAQDPARGREPQAAPRTPRKPGDGALIDDLVRKLRDELGLAIAPRDQLYSPSKSNKSQADRLYSRIQTLFWQEHDTLDAIIKECRADFTGQWSSLSAEQRNDHLFQKLDEPAWVTANRIRQPLLHASPGLRRTSTNPRSTQRSFQRVDSGIGTASPSTPGSPLAKKTMAEKANDNSKNAADGLRSRRSSTVDDTTTDTTAKTTPNTSFSGSTKTPDPDEGFAGSSIFSQWEGPTPGFPEGQTTESITPATNLGHIPAKRRRSDNVEDLETPKKKVKQEPQQFSESPTKLPEPHWQLKDMAKSGLGLDTIQDFDKFWKHPRPTEANSHVFWSASGSITLNTTNKGPLIQTKVNSLREMSESSRAQRYFGHDRIMTLNMPSLTRNLPRHIGGQDEDEARNTAVANWSTTPKSLLGREWWAFQVGEVDRTKGRQRQADKGIIRPTAFFATEGTRLSKKVSLFEFLDQWIPFKENASQPVCKLSARISLSTKQSRPSFCFNPKQIKRMKDILANGESEDTVFDDPAFHGRPQKTWDKKEVMTDGCAPMSVGAALEIRKCLGIQDWPAAYQGRINGAKGIWYVSAPYSTSDPDHTGIWIGIRPSQLKVEPREEDWDLVRCEEGRWCFDVKNYSRPAKASHLHKDFLSVLEDRHVPRANILAMVQEGVNADVKELTDMLESPAKLALWRHRNFPNTGHASHGKSSLPQTSPGKARLFMEQAGYKIHDNIHVAESFEWMIGRFLQRRREQLHFSCLKSTLLFGLADPVGVLRPGEVHLSLTRPLEDDETKEQFDHFAGNDVLIARDPTIRGSDMQKVRCICHPELSHLKDVVILPSKGRIPLAAKLQGGDYDGDTFWICADERLVSPFQNAPVLAQEGKEFFGIRQEKRTLGEIVKATDFGTDEHAKALLRIALPIAFQDKPLGYITSYCNTLSYNRRSSGGLWDDGVMMVADLHDLIIDAAKNGYSYSAKDFDMFLERERLPPAKMLRKCECDTNIKAAQVDNGKLLETLKSKPKHNSGHILDEILFNIINPPFYAYLRDFQSNVVEPAKQVDQDRDLEWPLIEIDKLEDQSERDFHPKIEQQALKTSLQAVVSLWNRAWKCEKDERRETLLSECWDKYDQIEPTKPKLHVWKMRAANAAPSYWDRFKLAVFARTRYKDKKRCIFWVATEIVRNVKSQSESGMEVVNKIQEIMKPKKPKEWARADTFDAPPIGGDDIDDEDDGSEFEDGFDERMFDSL
jgi:hypothetical protein